MRRFCVLTFALFLATPALSQLTVTRIVDGDTFELSDGQRVRLIGIASFGLTERLAIGLASASLGARHRCCLPANDRFTARVQQVVCYWT